MLHRDDSADNNRDLQAGEIPMMDSDTHFRVEWDAEGHPAESSVFAWLDGALNDDESDRVEAHTAKCKMCSAAVAEARGYIAASARILSVADYVPRQVVPGVDIARSAARIIALANAATESRTERAASQSSLRPGNRASNGGFRPSFVLRIAATVFVMVGGALLLLRDDGQSPVPRREPLPVASSTTRTAPKPAASDSSATNTDDRSNLSRELPPARTRVAETPKVAAMIEQQVSRERARQAAVAESVSAVRRDSPQSLPAVAIEATMSVRSQTKVGVAVATIVAAEPVREISGRVVDGSNSQPLSAVHITISGTTRSAVTDNAGHFVVRDIPANSQKIQFRRLGYAMLEIDAARLSNMAQPPDVQMTESILPLGPVVVTSVGGEAAPDRRAREVESRACSAADAEAARADAPIVRRIVLQRVSKSFTQGVLHDWPRTGDITPIAFNGLESRDLRGTATARDTRIELNINIRDAVWYVDVREFRGNNVRAANVKFLVSTGEKSCE